MRLDKKDYTLLIQVGLTNVICSRNNLLAWKLYREGDSFLSYITGSIVIITYEFFQSLPEQFVFPETCEVFIISRFIIKTAANTHQVSTLTEAMSVIQDGIEVKHCYFVVDPTLYLNLKKTWEAYINKVVVMRTDMRNTGSIHFDGESVKWIKKKLFTATDRLEQADFILYEKR